MFIAVPTRGAPRAETVMALQELRDENPGQDLSPVLYQIGRHGVVIARNAIVDAFMRSSEQTLIMVDDDVVPDPLFLTGLPALAGRFDVLGWPYPIAPAGSLRWAYRPAGDREGGLVPADFIGAGCIAITRRVLDALGPDPFRSEGVRRGVNGQAFQAVGEDMLFCQDAIAAGFEIGVDTLHPANHLLPGAWGLGIARLLEPESEAIPLWKIRPIDPVRV